MTEIITLNGKEYILKEEYDKLEKSKINFNKYLIPDLANVMAIIPKDRKEDIENSFELNLLGGVDWEIGNKQIWKLVSKELITPKSEGINNKFDLYKICQTTYSRELIDKAIKTSKAFGYSSVPEVFMLFNDEKDEWIENCPCLFIFDRSFIIMIAPRREKD